MAGDHSPADPDYEILIRDKDLNILGQVDTYDLHMVLKENQVGTWVLKVPLNSLSVDQVTFKGGIVVIRNGRPLMSGPVDNLHRTSDENGDQLEASGFDDMDALDCHLALPVPLGPPYTAQANDIRTGPSETIIKEYVRNNIGDLASSSRKLPYLTVEADAARGVNVTGNARFDNLLTICADLATIGGDLGFYIVQVGNVLEFRVYVPRDLTTSIQLSQDFGSMRDFDYSAKRAAANYIYVGGAGDGTARSFAEVYSSRSIARYGRRELFLDNRGGNTDADLIQQGEKTLTEKQDSTSFKVTPLDMPGARAIDDYGLGDKVSVIVDGVATTDVIRQMEIVADRDGELITHTVGAPTTSQILSMLGRLREFSRRLSSLERVK